MAGEPHLYPVAPPLLPRARWRRTPLLRQGRRCSTPFFLEAGGAPLLSQADNTASSSSPTAPPLFFLEAAMSLSSPVTSHPRFAHHVKLSADLRELQCGEGGGAPRRRRGEGERGVACGTVGRREAHCAGGE
jgi:hypothetical protein